VVRNSVILYTTANDGFHTDPINLEGHGNYSYRVCLAGTATCSNTATVAFF
jgi:thermitase